MSSFFAGFSAGGFQRGLRHCLAVLTLLGVFLHTPAKAQTAIFPDQTGETLISTLRSEYYPTNVRSYAAARDLMYSDYKIDLQSDNTVEGVYTGLKATYNPSSGADPSTTIFNQGINTEHTWPQSFFGSNDPMLSDIHHLFPTWDDANSTRNNHPFAEINDATTQTWLYNGTKTSTKPAADVIDLYSEYASSRFEPREQQKGNTARAIFYFWTMYATNSSVSSNQSNQTFFEDMKDVLFQWHIQDPADEREITRSGGIAAVQGNQNPFVLDSTLVRRAYFPNLAGGGGGGDGGGTGGGTGGGGGTGENPTLTSEDIWINEIHYDNASTDTGEFIEVVLKSASSFTLSDISVTLYNGNDGSSYDVRTLDTFTKGAVDGEYTFYQFTYPENGIQNGAPDGVALSHTGELVQFLSYEGVMTGAGGVANGVQSVDIGVAEDGGTPAGHSLALAGTGSTYADFTWQAPAAATKGALNTGQVFSSDSTAAPKVSALGLGGLNNGRSPSALTPFSVSIVALDSSGSEVKVVENVGVTLSLSSGSGEVSGTLAGTIVAGSATVSLDSVVYSIAEDSVVLAMEAEGLGSFASTYFRVLQAADSLVITGLADSVYTNSPFGFSIQAVRSGDGSLDSNYVKSVELEVLQGPGDLTGSAVVKATDGVARFSGLSLSETGSYQIQVSDGMLTAPATLEAVERVFMPSAPLFFSEYVEGTSNNKALEIFNPSDEDIVLMEGATSHYFVMLLGNADGVKTWASDGSVKPFANDASIPAGGVYVIGNPDADAAIKDVSDETSTATYFNGDDVVALIRDANSNGLYDANEDEILDMIGPDDGSMSKTVFAEVTLVRNTEVSEGTLSFDIEEWTVHPQNTFSYLGSHEQDGGGSSTSLNDPATLPVSFELEQNIPNPFNPLTSIRFSLAKAESARLEIYNALGTRVTTLAEGVFSSGTHQLVWDATGFASGVYYYRLTTAEGASVRRMSLLK